jgi:hypothetical protein
MGASYSVVMTGPYSVVMTGRAIMFLSYSVNIQPIQTMLKKLNLDPLAYADLVCTTPPQAQGTTSTGWPPEAHKQGCRETIAVSMYREIYSVAYQHCGRCGDGARMAWAAWARNVGGSDQGCDNASRVGVATRS